MPVELAVGEHLLPQYDPAGTRGVVQFAPVDRQRVLRRHQVVHRLLRRFRRTGRGRGFSALILRHAEHLNPIIQPIVRVYADDHAGRAYARPTLAAVIRARGGGRR
jgi:hypothetical protein